MASRRLIAGMVLVAVAEAALAQPVRIQSDYVGEACIRRIDAGANGILDENIHAMPDLSGYRIGSWSPLLPASDPFTGTWTEAGGFLRCDLTFLGLINPPGPLAQFNDYYAPFLYGPNPAFGYIEFDVDNRVSTGGEIAFPELRYLANAARFGGKPATPRFADRFVLIPEDLDDDLTTQPFCERSGEEFHIALFGDKIVNTIELAGDGDAIFEASERWVVRGRLFHRAHAFEMFSPAGGDGAYEPIIQLLYAHHVAENVTTVSLVFPLTNAAAALMSNTASAGAEPNDANDSNQASIAEALEDLKWNATSINSGGPLTGDPRFVFMAGWATNVIVDSLHPVSWDATCIVGMAYASQQGPGETYAMTDVMDDSLEGDFNGDGIVTCDDDELLVQYVTMNETPGVWGHDGVPDGIVHIVNFGPAFCVFDFDYDGTVSPGDANFIVHPGDLDDDCDVDMNDAALFVTLLTAPESLPPSIQDDIVLRADFTFDGAADGSDISGFVDRILAE